MSDRAWRNVAAILAVIVVILGAAAVASLNEPSAPGASAGPASSGVAAASPSASSAASGTSSAGPSGSESASASPSPSPTPAPALPATVTFTQLTLDARKDVGSFARFIAFTSDGPGTITATLASDTTAGTTHMCLRVGTMDVECDDWTSGTITTTTKAAHANWRVSVEGNEHATPTVELTITFPAVKPQVKISHARFDGTAYPDYNGIQVRFVPRADGDAKLAANWGGHNFVYEIDVINESSGVGGATYANLGPAPSTTKTFPVTANETWKVALQNIETGFGATDMTATVGWP
jgi:hypothetical protein